MRGINFSNYDNEKSFQELLFAINEYTFCNIKRIPSIIIVKITLETLMGPSTVEVRH